MALIVIMEWVTVYVDSLGAESMRTHLFICE